MNAMLITKPEQLPHDVDTAFSLVEKLIYSQVHKFQRAYGGDFDCLLGEAHECYMKGHAQFVAGKTTTGRKVTEPYAKTIRLHVWYGLFDRMRGRVKKYQATEAIGERDFVHTPDARFDTEGWRLTDDGEFVMGLLLDPPPSITKPLERKGGQPRNYRSVVREWLDDRGWTRDRINGAFDNIRTNLKNHEQQHPTV